MQRYLIVVDILDVSVQTVMQLGGISDVYFLLCEVVCLVYSDGILQWVR
jgi:hypothetical protein